MIHLHKDI